MIERALRRFAKTFISTIAATLAVQFANPQFNGWNDVSVYLQSVALAAVAAFFMALWKMASDYGSSEQH